VTEVAGKVLVHCHAGCRQEDVVAALRARGLWPEPQSRFNAGWSSSRITAGTKAERHVVAEYDYTDEAGVLLYQVLRYEPKDFRQRYPDGFGGWTWKKGARQVLYHLTEVLDAAIVFVVEGEKDVEALRERGFVATTAAGGAKAPWIPAFTDALRGREVIIWPECGHAWAREGTARGRRALGRRCANPRNRSGRCEGCL